MSWRQRQRPVVIGIAGRTGSGKTTAALKVQSHFLAERVLIIHQDNYYRDLVHLPLEERARINYDHPEAFETPTQSLNSAVPVPDPRREQQRKRFILKGEPPSPANPPPGCVFHPRCPLAVDECIKVVPSFREVRPAHFVACHLADLEGHSQIRKVR